MGSPVALRRKRPLPWPLLEQREAPEPRHLPQAHAPGMVLSSQAWAIPQPAEGPPDLGLESQGAGVRGHLPQSHHWLLVKLALKTVNVSKIHGAVEETSPPFAPLGGAEPPRESHPQGKVLSAEGNPCKPRVTSLSTITMMAKPRSHLPGRGGGRVRGARKRGK